MEEKA
jgi:hypothetical protein